MVAEISTHALREEGDFCESVAELLMQISTHALREEGDPPRRPPTADAQFLPTPPARRATAGLDDDVARVGISTHALREEGDRQPPGGGDGGQISTHALREEGDPGRADRRCACSISTHALREEGDGQPVHAGRRLLHFYPRPPRGGRPIVSIGTTGSCNFYPRPPRGGRRPPHLLSILRQAFLPTPSARRATFLHPVRPVNEEFLPTPSARRATRCQCGCFYGSIISTHALREEGDKRRLDLCAQSH